MAVQEYRYTFVNVKETGPPPIGRLPLEPRVNEHLAEMAGAGWELVAGFPLNVETFHHGSETGSINFIWRRSGPAKP